MEQPYYLSPELASGHRYSAPADLWALGVVAYEMITLQRPFVAENPSRLFSMIRNHDVDINPLTGNGNDHLGALATSMFLLNRDATTRMTAQGILSYLRDTAEQSGLAASQLEEAHESCRQAVSESAEIIAAKVDKRLARGAVSGTDSHSDSTSST